MSAASCPRIFEAEAMRDGRLVGAERASFERHLGTCGACTREVRALEALAQKLRATDEGAPRVDALHARRERTRLIAAFDRALVLPERTWSTRRGWFGLAGAAALAALAAGVVLWRARPFASGPSSAPAHAARAVVQADAAAVWTERADQGGERVVLERGALRIHVDHGAIHGRFVVELPDGELEDIGTTFTVSAADGRTTRVAVEEGSVVVRLRGQPAVSVGAGTTWTSAPPAPASTAPPATSAPPAPRVAPWAPAPAAPPAPDASSEFRAAMAALDAGDACAAASRFSGFFDAHPRDGRAEDAAYLRVIALERCGDADGTRDAARAYLRVYPAGFRRAEVEALSR